MLKRSLLCLFIPLLLTPAAFAQQDDGGSFGISFKGFVKSDLMFDSRQTVSVREGHFLLYPAPEALDAENEDINAEPNLNMLAIQTRLTGVITAPDAFGAKTSGVIEGAFFGHSNSDINGFRLRHAFVKLAWENSSLLAGQYWHPMFITEVFPGVISFNTGVPFQPFSRNPQVRYVQNFENFKLTLTAASQRDFASTGPDGTGSQYLRNAVVPILDANLKYVTPTLVAGVGVDYMSLRPRLALGFTMTDETIDAISLIGFAKVVTGDLQIKAEGIMGQNTFDKLMLGGYAVSEIDPETGQEMYTNIKTMSVWGELIYGKDLQVAVFGGYTKNDGADDEIAGQYFSRGSNIASVMRIAPRVQCTKGKFRIALELEHTIAEYGMPDENGVVGDFIDGTGAITKEMYTVANTRVLVAAYLFF